MNNHKYIIIIQNEQVILEIHTPNQIIRIPNIIQNLKPNQFNRLIQAMLNNQPIPEDIMIEITS